MKLYYLNEDQQDWIRLWWQALQPAATDAPPRPAMLASLNRGDRAALRHGATVDELLLTSATHLLARRLLTLESEKTSPRFDQDAYPALAMIAGALSQVITHVPSEQSLPLQLGFRANPDRPPFSELRFRRMQKARHDDDFYRQLVRMVRQAGRQADIRVVAEDLLGWYLERSRTVSPARSQKFRWARDYYNAV
ncbi:type I-E CRISPR-associated protein Cse2/CasB [Chitiniphilus eburneus]|uniref:Type I-E CRISPR-associated protein Cse2/CasB n=1 Tax=Chitiniphilus eburneus TaxID=2571148 RepID=A0A4U0PR30_9NEIS|nr:type I-E CRISPR-associated protein Cse2/CasB [Chitiniphilus eburneus]TJZ70709.1 type I-E CRISPR-associated protein Cse2/CasB [Chitiniphilus eburneus]